MMASSSLTLLKTSKPPIFHSPLSEVYIDPTLMLPWIEEASSLMNLRVRWQVVSLCANDIAGARVSIPLRYICPISSSRGLGSSF